MNMMKLTLVSPYSQRQVARTDHQRPLIIQRTPTMECLLIPPANQKSAVFHCSVSSAEMNTLSQLVVLLLLPCSSLKGAGRSLYTGSYNGTHRTNRSVYGPLIEYVFKDYNPLALPICRRSDVVHITLDMWLYQLFDLDMPKQNLTIDVWIDINWKDCSIFWDPNKFNGIKDMVLPSHTVWFPDIFTYQGLHGNIKEGLFVFRESSVKISHEGAIQMGAQLLLKTFCRVNILDFPYDEQMCPITFSAWNKDQSIFKMTKKAVHEDDSGHSFTAASNGEWYVVGFNATDSHLSFHTGITEENEETFSEVTFTLHLKRKPKFIQVYLMFPCMLLLWITSITFVLPVGCGEKISLVSTILLSLIVFLLMAAGYVPDTSDSVPVIGKFYYISIVLVVFAMILTTIVLNISHKDADVSMPTFLQNMLYSKSTRFLCVSFQRISTEQNKRMTKDYHRQDGRTNKWMQLGMLLDRIFLLIYLLVCVCNTIYMITIE